MKMNTREKINIETASGNFNGKQRKKHWISQNLKQPKKQKNMSEPLIPLSGMIKWLLWWNPEDPGHHFISVHLWFWQFMYISYFMSHLREILRDWSQVSIIQMNYIFL